MKITRLEKKKRLYLLELDKTETLYITEDTIVRFLLSKGKTITPEELTDIQRFAQFSYGKNLALYYLSFQRRTTKETKNYLIKHDISSDAIEAIIDNLTKDKWLDDTAYAQAYFEKNQSTGDKGAYVIKQKLKQKGISSAILEEVSHQFDYQAIANRVAEKLFRKYGEKLPLNALKTKILQSLTNKGFDYQTAKIALENLELEKDDENELLLIFNELDKQHRKYSKKYDGYELKQRLTQALMRKGYQYSDIQTALREYL